MTTVSIGTFHHWRVVNDTMRFIHSTFIRFTFSSMPRTEDAWTVQSGWIR